MLVLGIDIGGKTRNGFGLVDSKGCNLIESSYVSYDENGTPLEHRKKILLEAIRYLDKYEVDYILFEKINLFRGSNISHLSNILSLCRVQTTLMDNLSDRVKIACVIVRTWKAQVLGNGNADKDDALKFVGMVYPKVNLDAVEYTKKTRKKKIVKNHDMADAICIALFGVKNKSVMDENILSNL